MEIAVRMTDNADIPELVRLRLAYFAEEFGALPAEQLERITAQLPAYFTAHLNRDCFVSVAALPDGSLAACAILLVSEKPANPFFVNGKTGYVLGVFTMPAYRKQGIAARMMQLLMAESQRLALDQVTLSASRMGYGIYERLGFRISESDYTEMEWSPPKQNF